MYTKLIRQGGEGIIEEKWRETNLEIQHLFSIDEGHWACCEECYKEMEECLSSSQTKGFFC